MYKSRAPWHEGFKFCDAANGIDQLRQRVSSRRNENKPRVSMRYERTVCICATVSQARRIEKLSDRCACIKLYNAEPAGFVGRTTGRAVLEINGAKNQNAREIRPRDERQSNEVVSLIRRRSHRVSPPGGILSRVAAKRWLYSRSKIVSRRAGG